MDGTLLDTERIYQKYWKIAADELGYNLSTEQLLLLRSLGHSFGIEKMKELTGSAEAYDKIRDYRKKLMDPLMENMEVIPLKPKVKEALAFLKDKGIRLAVEVFLFLHDAAFLPRNLIPAFFRIAVELLAEAVDVLLRLEHELLLACFSFLFCIRNDLDRFGLSRANLRFRTAFPGCITGACADDHCNDYR